MPFCRGSHCPLVYNRPFACISYSFGAMPSSILPKISIWVPNLKIGTFTTLVKVKVGDTYGVIVSSPKQFDLDMSKVKFTERF